MPLNRAGVNNSPGPIVVSGMEILNKILIYLRLRKPDPDAPSNFNLKVMHGINRISILMFLFCVGLLIFKACTR